MLIAVVGDLHAGSRFCDLPALFRLLDKLPELDEVIFLGDLVDNVNMYATHSATNVPLRDQFEALAELIFRRVAKKAGVARIALGNHDTNVLFAYDELIEATARSVGLEVHVEPEISRWGALFTHYIVKASSGSLYTAITPLIYSKFLELQIQRKRFYDFAFFSHIHKRYAAVERLIHVPAFLASPDPLQPERAIVVAEIGKSNRIERYWPIFTRGHTREELRKKVKLKWIVEAAEE